MCLRLTSFVSSRARPQSRVERISETARSGFGGMFAPNFYGQKVTFASKSLAYTHRANGPVAVCEIHSTALCCAARYDIIKHVRVHTKITKTHRQPPICRPSNFDLLRTLFARFVGAVPYTIPASRAINPNLPSFKF